MRRFALWGHIVATDALKEIAPDLAHVSLIYRSTQTHRCREEILAEEDEAELARSKVEWLEHFHNSVRDDAVIAEFDT